MAKTDWSRLFSSYPKGKVVEQKSDAKFLDYNDFAKVYYSKNNEETVEDPNCPSHVIEDEQYEQYVNAHIIEDENQEIVTKQDAFEAAIADGGRPIELQEPQETHLVDGPTPRPEEEPDFTAEELAEFKTLNKLDEIHEVNNEPVLNVFKEDTITVPLPNETQVIEQPTLTTVKSIRVSKPKVPRAPKAPKVKKETTEVKPKAPRGRKPKK